LTADCSYRLFLSIWTLFYVLIILIAITNAIFDSIYFYLVYFCKHEVFHWHWMRLGLCGKHAGCGTIWLSGEHLGPRPCFAVFGVICSLNVQEIEYYLHFSANLH